MRGLVERRLPGRSDWAAVELGDRIPEGWEIRTAQASDIDLSVDQGHKLHVAPESQVTLAALQDAKTKTYITKGKVLSKVVPLKSQEQFLIQTPSAVCAVRGTEFWTGANDKGTAVEVYKGVVGLRSQATGSEVAVHPGEVASVLRDGTMIPPHAPQNQSKAAPESPLTKEARHEVGLDMTRNEVMAAAAAEIRLAEYREGKSMVDVEGRRVRLEEYIVRPAANQFKFVVLNERDQRLDYFFYSGTFNQTLPADLSTALRDLSGKFGTMSPNYYLTSYEMGQSNTQDSVHYTATGGHLVKITIDSNGDYVLTDATDPTNTRTVTATQLQLDGTYKVYDPLSDSFLTLTAAQLATGSRFGMYIQETETFQDLAPGDTFWKTRFNAYQHDLNDNHKISYSQSGATNVLASNLDANWTYAGGFVLPVVTADPNNLDYTITNYYGDGTYEQYRTALIDNEGTVAPLSAFSGVSSGSAYKNELLKWNYEQQVSASEFEGRKIDLVVEPKIFIESGLIP